MPAEGVQDGVHDGARRSRDQGGREALGREGGEQVHRTRQRNDLAAYEFREAPFEGLAERDMVGTAGGPRGRAGGTVGQVGGTVGEVGGAVGDRPAEDERAVLVREDEAEPDRLLLDRPKPESLGVDECAVHVEEDGLEFDAHGDSRVGRSGRPVFRVTHCPCVRHGGCGSRRGAG